MTTGDYFAWGEIETKADFNWETYKFMDPEINDYTGCTKYTIDDGQDIGIWYNNETGVFEGDNLTELEDEDNVAKKLLGSNWTIPSDAYMQELINFCHWEWTSDYKKSGVSGYIVYKMNLSEEYEYNEENDIHIFLPAADSKRTYTSEEILVSRIADRSAIRFVDNEEPVLILPKAEKEVQRIGFYWTSSLGNDSDYSKYLSFETHNYINNRQGSRSIGGSVRAIIKGRPIRIENKRQPQPLVR